MKYFLDMSNAEYFLQSEFLNILSAIVHFWYARIILLILIAYFKVVPFCDSMAINVKLRNPI